MPAHAHQPLINGRTGWGLCSHLFSLFSKGALAAGAAAHLFSLFSKGALAGGSEATCSASSVRAHWLLALRHICPQDSQAHQRASSESSGHLTCLRMCKPKSGQHGCVQALQSLSTFPGPQPSVGMGMPHIGQQQGTRQPLPGYGEPAFPRPSSPSGDPAAPAGWLPAGQQGRPLWCSSVLLLSWGCHCHLPPGLVHSTCKGTAPHAPQACHALKLVVARVCCQL